MPGQGAGQIVCGGYGRRAGEEGQACRPGAKADISLSLLKGGNLGREGYRLQIARDGVRLGAAAPTGLFWGTRTLLQMLRQTPGSVPCGTAVDFPRYQLRGFMLDVARTPYPSVT